MLVKKFEAESMTSALQQVKETLGAEALILSTRTFSKKGLGVLGRQIIEVTAAIESPAMANSFMKPAARQETLGYRKSASAISQRIEMLDDEEVTLSRRAQQSRHESRPLPRQQKVELREDPIEAEIKQLRAQLEAQDIGRLQEEIHELKQLMQQLSETQERAMAAAAPPSESAVLTALVADAVQREKMTAVPHVQFKGGERLADLIEMLVERGIDADAAATVARFAEPQIKRTQRYDQRACRQFLTSTVAGLVKTSGPLWTRGERQKRVALIGATGVGKTTTIAKLAAEAITRAGARVALVTIDTYRIAAVEQLRVYGDIMGLPVEVVLSPEQLQDAFAKHRDKDLILIDTAGRSPRDSMQINELLRFLGPDAGVENCLVMAAPTAERLLQRNLQAFSKLPLSSLIFTKLDETDSCGAMINLSLRSNLPLAYLTNGQKVPEDLLQADAGQVAALVMNPHDEVRRMAI